MKKNAIKMIVLAIMASAVLPACEKENSTSKISPMPVVQQTNIQWPANALTSGDDTYCYLIEGNRSFLGDIVDTMLGIYYTSDHAIDSLPEGFCTIWPVADQMGGNTNGVIVLFEGRDRLTAISELKNIDGIYAIQPVYSNNHLVVATPLINVFIENVNDTSYFINVADSLLLKRIMVPSVNSMTQHSGWMLRFYVDHSYMNSVATANKIYELGCGHGIVYAWPGLSTFNPVLD